MKSNQQKEALNEQLAFYTFFWKDKHNEQNIQL